MIPTIWDSRKGGTTETAERSVAARGQEGGGGQSTGAPQGRETTLNDATVIVRVSHMHPNPQNVQPQV